MTSLYNRIIGSTVGFVRRNHIWVAGSLLALMLGLGLSSMVSNSAIVDEVAHIPAGYSYLHYGDYRLNPEHPPLMKDLAALPLQFMNLKFPKNEPAWTTEVNGEWDAGYAFLYNLGNNASAILFWARLPILLLAVGFGAWLYWACRKRWGTAVALLTLLFYTLSPNFLGHGALVTTDLGASIFMFLALLTFGRFVNKPTRTNMFLLSLAIALAELAKFSAALLYPFLGLVTLALVWWGREPRTKMKRIKTYVGGLVAASALSVLWIWIFYTPHVWNMPIAVQDKLILVSLYSPNDQGIAHVLVNMSHWPLMKPMVQYLLGLVMDFGRVVGGNVTYFNGAVTDQSFRWYFFELFAVKTQVALLVLMVVAVGVGLWRLMRGKPGRVGGRLAKHFRTHVLEWTLGAFAVFYFLVSVSGNLDLGIRHILPVYLPVFVVTAIATVQLTRRLARTRWRVTSQVVLALLLVWYAGSTIMVTPNYIAYFNELIGGPGNAYKYFTDSSVDWGQDLIRLQQYIVEHPQIKHIAVDYFGGAIPQYYFCQRAYDAQGNLITDGTYDCSHSKIEIWHAQYGRYTGQYIAVSETYLENDAYFAAQGNRSGYGYLRSMTPIAKIGNSIYVYKMY